MLAWILHRNGIVLSHDILPCRFTAYVYECVWCSCVTNNMESNLTTVLHYTHFERRSKAEARLNIVWMFAGHDALAMVINVVSEFKCTYVNEGNLEGEWKV